MKNCFYLIVKLITEMFFPSYPKKMIEVDHEIKDLNIFCITIGCQRTCCWSRTAR